jgi:hypothetical protein
VRYGRKAEYAQGGKGGACEGTQGKNCRVTRLHGLATRSQRLWLHGDRYQRYPSTLWAEGGDSLVRFDTLESTSTHTRWGWHLHLARAALKATCPELQGMLEESFTSWWHAGQGRFSV